MVTGPASRTTITKSGRERDTAARINPGPRRGHSRAADSKLLTSALRFLSHPRPPTTQPLIPTPTTPATIIDTQIPAKTAPTPPSSSEPRSQEAISTPPYQPHNRSNPGNCFAQPLDFHRSPKAGHPAARSAVRLCLGNLRARSLALVPDPTASNSLIKSAEMATKQHLAGTRALGACAGLVPSTRRVTRACPGGGEAVRRAGAARFGC